MEELLNKLPENKQSIAVELQDYQKRWFNGEVKSSDAEGRRYLPGFEADTAIHVRDKWDGIRDGDVFIIAYPKTGTNWVTDTVERIYQVKDSSRMKYKIFDPLIFFKRVLETGPVEKFKILGDLHPPKNRVLFSHVDADTFPVEKATKKGAKIMYVLRNPKDQTVSWYHFASKLPFLKNDSQLKSNWENFTAQYFTGMHRTGNIEGEWYPEHILSWYKYKDQENVKFIYYEDMKKDFKKEIRNIASFLDVELTDEEVATVAHDCSFDVVKKNLDEVRRGANILRKGGVGGWKDYFTVAQSEAIDAEFDEKLSNTDIKFTYQL